MKSRKTSRRRATSASRDSSHDRILQSAKSLFASKGYDNTSTVAIARMAGTSESQLMKHFGSKEGLLEAIFEQAWQKMLREIRESLRHLASPTEKFLALVDLTTTALEGDADLKVLLLLEGRHIRKEGRMILLTQGFLDFVRLVDEILGEMCASGELRADVPIEGIRSAVMGALEGMLRDQILARRIRFPARFTPKQAREIFGMLLESFRGTRSRSASTSEPSAS